jgi:polyisoprenoid-binding protein YceI
MFLIGVPIASFASRAFSGLSTEALTVSASLAFVLAALPLFVADRYRVDPEHTKIGFSVPHIVISTVEAQFKSFEGIILLDTPDITKSSVKITINTDGVDTSVAKECKGESHGW